MPMIQQSPNDKMMREYRTKGKGGRPRIHPPGVRMRKGKLYGQGNSERTTDVLEHCPHGAHEVAKWFGQIDDKAFDAVCCSAVAFTIEDEIRDAGFVSARSVNVMVSSMRDRYRAMLKSKDG